MSETISAIPLDGFNLRVVSPDSPEACGQSKVIHLQPEVPSHQWFAASLHGLPVDEPSILCVKLLSDVPPGNRADINKWIGLRPLMTYADPLRYESYEWFERDQGGRWISSDLFKRGEERVAGSGAVPLQHVVPARVAVESLSPDGRYWSPWFEIETADAQVAQHCLSIQHRFSQPSASIALHPPFTYTYLCSFLDRLRDAHLPGVFIDEIGTTPEGRALRVIRIDDPEKPISLHLDAITEFPDGTIAPNAWIDDPSDGRTDTHQVIVIVAREHATEHVASWIIPGILKALCVESDADADLRRNITWLIVPVFDPDGSTHSFLNRLTYRFTYRQPGISGIEECPQEVVMYVRYLRAFVNSGRPISTICSLYGLECNEGESVCSPFARQSDVEVAVAFNRYWFSRLERVGIPCGSSKPWDIGFSPFRFPGWCADLYTALPVVFEINDRYPECRLTLRDLETIGNTLPEALVSFLDGCIGYRRRLYTEQQLEKRKARMMHRGYTLDGGPLDRITRRDMIVLGY